MPSSEAALEADRPGRQQVGGVSALSGAHTAPHWVPPQASSFSSITDSTMSLNIITVTLNMGEALWAVGAWWGVGTGLGSFWGLLMAPPAERHHFLGISIVGQSNDRGDGGIYIGSIMKGGAVAADGRIEPGDMLLQVGAMWGLWGQDGPTSHHQSLTPQTP